MISWYNLQCNYVNMFLFQINVLKADNEVDKRGKEEFPPKDEGKGTY